MTSILPRFSSITVAVAWLLVAGACTNSPPPPGAPSVRGSGVPAPDAVAFRPFADTLHGVVVRDPLRWMEDTLSPDVREWMMAQGQYADSILGRLTGRDSLAAAMNAIWQGLSTLGSVVPGNNRLFFDRYLGDAPSLFALDANTTEERELLSATALEAARDGARLRTMVPSWDGRLLAIGTTERGDAHAGVSVLDAVTGGLLKDRIPDLLTTTSSSRYEVTWLPDNSGFIYPRLWPNPTSASDALSRGRQFVHRIGTPQSADVPIFGFGVSPSVPFDPADLPTKVFTAPGSAWLVASVYRVRTSGDEYFAARVRPDASGAREWRQIATSDDRIGSVQLVGDTVYALTRHDADRAAIVRWTLSASAADSGWLPVVPERDGVIITFARQHDALYFTERTQREGVVLQRRGHGDTTIRSIPVNGGGGGTTIARTAPMADGATISVSSWVMPPRWLFVPPDSLGVRPLGIDDSSATPSNAKVTATRVEARSQDGTMVPVSVVYSDRALRNGRLDGTAPLLIEAYGAYGAVEDAGYRPEVEMWIAQGGVYAYAHVRGGGENGDAWHRSATREHKQRTIDDMIAAIETVIDKRYTSAGRVVLIGISSGAVIPGLVAMQRPDLLAAALYEVGQPDEIRGAAFDPTSARNLDELGDLDTPAGIRSLMASSPYHVVPERVALPAIIVHSASEDYNFGTEMLVAKFVARLQQANSGSRPVLWIRTPGGHQPLLSLSPEWTASLMSFALWQSGVSAFQPVDPNASAR